jgi:hypothetical protein
MQEQCTFWDQNKIEQLTNPVSWWILKRSDDGTATEEVIFTIQGIIRGKDLPPVLEKPRCIQECLERRRLTLLRIASHQYKYLRQSISLGGLGSPTFTNAIRATKDIHRCFNRQFAEGTLEPWTEDEGAEIVDLSNRYLTPVSEAGDMEDINFLPGVDPKGLLRDLARGDGTCTYIHTEDNQVSYYNGHRDSTGNRRCVTFTQPASNNL